MFANYGDDEEFPLKQQERINRVTNFILRVYTEKNAQEMIQGKAYQQYFENKKNKVEPIHR